MDTHNNALQSQNVQENQSKTLAIINKSSLDSQDDKNIMLNTLYPGSTCNDNQPSLSSMLQKNNLGSDKEEKKENSDDESLSHLKSYRLLQIGKEYLKTEGLYLCNKVGMIYNIEIHKKGEKTPYFITADVKNKPGKLVVGKYPDPDATVIVQDEVMSEILDGKLHPASALLQRKLIVKGKLAAIMKFKPDVLKIRSKL